MSGRERLGRERREQGATAGARAALGGPYGQWEDDRMRESTNVTVPPPEQLRADIDRAGYYPAVVADAFLTALAGEAIEAHLVHQETTFDGDEVRRHITVLAITPTRLVIGHTDDHPAPDAPADAPPVATTSTEGVPLARVHSVVVTRVIADPGAYRPGMAASEITVTLGWGAVSRIDLEPATCGDPQCEADHGSTGTISADDLSLRVSTAAEGEDAVHRALSFAAALSAATAR